MEGILAAARDKDDLVRLVKLSQARGMEGIHGTWEEFLKSYDLTYGQIFLSPSSRSEADLRAFLKTLYKDENLRLLALSMRPTRCLVYDFSRMSNCTDVKGMLAQMTLNEENHNLEYLSPYYNPKDWVVIGLKDTQLRARSGLTNNMIAVRCAIVACEDGSEAVAKVAAVDYNFNVILDAFVKPNKPVADYRTVTTEITAQDVENAETLSLVDVQNILLSFFAIETIMVGCSLHRDLKALKMDHARVIDFSAIHSKPLSCLSKDLLGIQRLPVDPVICVFEALATMGIARLTVNTFWAVRRRERKELRDRKRKRTFVVRKLILNVLGRKFKNWKMIGRNDDDDDDNRHTRMLQALTRMPSAAFQGIDRKY